MIKLTYNEAIARIEEILGQIDAQQVDVDALAARVAEARKLVRRCQAMLKKTGDELAVDN